MIERPFNVYDHPKLLKLKVCYTLDTPYRNTSRAQLAEYILAVACRGRTGFTPDEWQTVLETIEGSNLKVGEWLAAQETQVQEVANVV